MQLLFLHYLMCKLHTPIIQLTDAMTNFLSNMTIKVTTNKNLIAGNNPTQKFIEFPLFHCWPPNLWVIVQDKFTDLIPINNFYFSWYFPWSFQSTYTTFSTNKLLTITTTPFSAFSTSRKSWWLIITNNVFCFSSHFFGIYTSNKVNISYIESTLFKVFFEILECKKTDLDQNYYNKLCIF